MNSDSPDTHHPIRCVVDADAASSSSSHRRTRIRNPRKKRTIIMDEDDHNNNNNVVLKPKYGKKPDPGAPKITRPCTECGKKFWSWKALFGHMRCHPERQWRGINPPPNFRQQPKQQQQPQFQNMTQEDHEVAACLLLLANGNKVVNEDINLNANGTESPSLSVSSHHHYQHQERFECSSCKKVFGSHQALGGHRASHKNVKGCFARDDGDPDNEDHHHHHHINMNMNNMNMMMIHSGATGLVGDNDQHQHQHQHVHPHDSVVGHKCSICLRVFSTGQALGGHKRCHWDKGDNVNDPSIAALAPNVVDLNLPPPVEDHCSSSPPLTLDLRLGL